MTTKETLAYGMGYGVGYKESLNALSRTVPPAYTVAEQAAWLCGWDDGADSASLAAIETAATGGKAS